MRSITKLDLQYAHRFYGFKGEAQYLHGHTGVLTIEVEDTVEPGVNMVFPCNEIQKTAWDVLKNFDHALILREDDPLLPAILKVYEEQGIKDGAPTNNICHGKSYHCRRNVWYHYFMELFYDRWFPCHVLHGRVLHDPEILCKTASEIQNTY